MVRERECKQNCTIWLLNISTGRNGRWCSGILYVLILDFRSGLSLIYPGFLFRVIPYSVPWFETVQGSHPIFFQKTSGLSHISENHISETTCTLQAFFFNVFAKTQGEKNSRFRNNSSNFWLKTQCNGGILGKNSSLKNVLR